MSKSIGPTFFPPLGPAKLSGSKAPTGWDKCVLGGQVLPGHTSITRGGIKLKVDPKSKPGSDGTNQTYHGLDPQPIELENITYCDEDRETLASLVRQLVPQAGKAPTPVSIDHPSIRHLNIATVQVVGAGPLLPVEGKPGVTKMTLLLEHWSPSKTTKSATKTPKRAVRNVRGESVEKNYVEKNPAPTAQPDVWAPPAFG